MYIKFDLHIISRLKFLIKLAILGTQSFLSQHVIKSFMLATFFPALFEKRREIYLIICNYFCFLFIIPARFEFVSLLAFHFRLISDNSSSRIAFISTGLKSRKYIEILFFSKLVFPNLFKVSHRFQLKTKWKPLFFYISQLFGIV